MDLFGKRLPRREAGDYAGRLAELEDYVEYLRQQGEYGLSRTEGAVPGPGGQSRADSGIA